MNLPADEFPQSPEAVREALTIPATDFPADLPLGSGSWLYVHRCHSSAALLGFSCRDTLALAP